MNRKPIGYGPEDLDEFLHGYKSAWADKARMMESMWPVDLVQDKELIWPSQVILDPSLAVGQNTDSDIKSQQDAVKSNISNPWNKIVLLNLNIMNGRRLSALEISKNFEGLKVETKYEDTPTSSMKINKNDHSKMYRTYEDPTTTTHKAVKALFLSCTRDGQKIARIYCYRPFFKKIEDLCKRIKLELIHYDNVIAHVHSCGIVWIIKDLVFISTRIINAWNITKCYVYDPSVGLNKVRSSLSTEFVSSFVAWQEATFDFVENLMISFLCLDIWVQTSSETSERFEFLSKKNELLRGVSEQIKSCSSLRQRTNWAACGCSSTCELISASQPTHDALLELSILCTEHGEKIANNYASRRIFNKIDKICDRTKFELIRTENAVNNLNSQGIVWAIKELIFAITRIIIAWNVAKGYVYNCSKDMQTIQAALSSQFISSFNTWQATTITFVENLKISFLKLDHFAHTENNSNRKKNIFFKEMMIFKEQLKKLRSARVFSRALSCRIYFPDFIEQTPDFIDVDTIINKLQNEMYSNIFEVVDDVRFTINQVKNYLMRNFDVNLEMAVNYFIGDVNKILKLNTFENYQFDHIDGRPHENLLYT